MDVSSQYWQIGGSTVAAKNFIRLTPSSQSRVGWLFNDYTLKSKEWEVEIGFEVKSEFHLGGDAWAIWFLEQASTQSFRNSGHNWLSGPIAGIREDFKGFGLVFDTYDNDGDRANPTVMVLKSDGNDTQWDADNDYGPNRVQEGLQDTSVENTAKRMLDTKCTLDYRNRPRPSKVLLRYQAGALHVYATTGNINTADASGSSGIFGRSPFDYSFCLAVTIGIDTEDRYNIAFTALTGQVADVHQITSVQTRYLDDKDPVIDDWAMRRIGTSQATMRRAGVLWWLCLLVVGVYLAYGNYTSISEIWSQKKNRGNTVSLCYRVAQTRSLGAKLSVAVFAVAVFVGEYTLALLNFPKFLIHAYEFMTKFKLQSSELEKPTLLGCLRFEQALQIENVMGLLAVTYYIYCLSITLF